RDDPDLLEHAVSRSALHEVDLVAVDRGAVAVDEQHDRQAHADLGGGHRDREEGEDLSGDRRLPAVVGAEGDKVDVHGVEDQLDRHEDEHAVLAGEHAVDADREQDRAEEEKLTQKHQSRLAITMAPTRAASSSTETTSNGTR